MKIPQLGQTPSPSHVALSDANRRIANALLRIEGAHDALAECTRTLSEVAERLEALGSESDVPLVLAHLALILYAVRGGLSAAEILARTQGSAFWALFYGLFVLAVAVHAPIGLRNVLREWFALRGAVLGLVAWLAFALFLLLGLRAVAAVVLP